MIKIYFIFLAIIALTLGFINKPQEKNVVSPDEIVYIEVEVDGYCKRPGTYKIPEKISKEQLLSLVGVYESAIYKDFTIANGTYILFYEPPTNPIVISKASLEELDSLPGIGEVKAQTILDYLANNQVFDTWDEFFDLVKIRDEDAKFKIKSAAVLR